MRESETKVRNKREGGGGREGGRECVCQVYKNGSEVK